MRLHLQLDKCWKKSRLSFVHFMARNVSCFFFIDCLMVRLITLTLSLVSFSSFFLSSYYVIIIRFCSNIIFICGSMMQISILLILLPLIIKDFELRGQIVTISMRQKSIKFYKFSNETVSRCDNTHWASSMCTYCLIVLTTYNLKVTTYSFKVINFQSLSDQL